MHDIDGFFMLLRCSGQEINYEKLWDWQYESAHSTGRLPRFSQFVG